MARSLFRRREIVFRGESLSIKFVARFFISFMFVVFFSLPSPAQQTPPPANSAPATSQPDSSTKPAASAQGAQSPASNQTPSDKDKAKAGQSTGDQGKAAGTSNDRLFLALPNFLTLENGGKVPPLTSAQKFKVVARGSFDKIEFPWYGILSGISQAENSEPGYGQGWEGYGKRYASAFADGTIENFMVAAVMPSILHQDPRFFQTSQGTFSHRAGYAVSRIVVTRTDSGHSQFNYSEIIGSALSAAISTNSYHPRAFISRRWDPTTNMVTYVHNASSRTLSNTLSVWGTQIAYDTITIVIKEFWPDIHRKMPDKSKSDTPPADSSHP
jgi:hypothetical protein